MRIEIEAATPEVVPAAAATVPRRRRLDPFELGVLIALAAVSVWVLGLDLWQVLFHGRVWTGTDGFFVIDQMQYLAWIRDASHHLFASNLFVLRNTPSDYFQPGVALSGAISALGVAPWLSLLLWKPVAVAGIFYGARTYVHRSVTQRSERRAALALGLFFGSFTVVYGSFGVIGDLFPGFLSWGYPFGLLALAAMVLALLSYDRARKADIAGGGRGRLIWTPALLGALASSLHPWQGELLILIVVGAELVSSLRPARHPASLKRAGLESSGWRERLGAKRRLALPMRTVIATALPLVYYIILGRLDLSWGLARDASKHSFSFWSVLLALAPLALPAVLGYRGRPRNFLAVVTRVWPIAALAVYILSATELSATPLHAFEGVTIPLAVLAVEGVRRAGWRRVPHRRLIGSLAVAAATLPATLYELSIAHDFMAPTPGNANFITRDERNALDYLADDRERGGVLTRFYLGAVVPAKTGRHTFVGNCLWSEPGCTPRAEIAEQLLDGSLRPQQASTFVRRTGARFVLTDCQSSADLTGALGSQIVAVHRFGCAAVYELDAPDRPSGALAESHLDAAVRAPRRQ